MNPEFQRTIDEVFQRADVEHHPFFRALQSRALSPEEFRRGALQIYHVVHFFPRFLAALIANMDDHKERLDLVGNLYEEHGHMKEEHFHITTYRQFLDGAGISPEEILRSRPIPPVVAYTRGVYDLCLHHHYLEGAAALGVIEQIVAIVSPIVARAALEGGFIPRGKLVHFDDHAVLDVTHAQEIYAIADSYFGDPQNREHILLGLALGMYYHTRLYTDIFEFVKGGKK
jgi:pyrroloquinoline quinone (PQQ) biosynthesis protein C